MVPRLAFTVAFLWIAGCTTGPIPLSPQVMKQMPPAGALHPGEVVYVDEGGCPAGQVKRVVGGSNRVYGTNIEQASAPRQVSCVARP